MPRYYKPISLSDLKTKVKAAYEIFEEDYEFSPQITKDLAKVNFDFENYTGEGADDFEKYIANYPVGYKELTPDFPVHFVNAGGDWEWPVCFVFYWDGSELRAYIPKDGNAWNKKEKCAYGSEQGSSGLADDIFASNESSEDKIIADVLKRIQLK